RLLERIAIRSTDLLRNEVTRQRRWPEDLSAARDGSGLKAARLCNCRKQQISFGQKVMKITVETNVAAPIEAVWQAYTTPADIKQWNAASDDWHTTAASVDLREGGTFSSRMEAKDGSMGFDFAGTYTKIIPHERIEYAFGGRTAQVEFSRRP